MRFLSKPNVERKSSANRTERFMLGIVIFLLSMCFSAFASALPTPRLTLEEGNNGNEWAIGFNAPSNSPADYTYELYRRSIGSRVTPTNVFATRSVANGNRPPFLKNLPNNDWSGYEYLSRVCSASENRCGSYSRPLVVEPPNAPPSVGISSPARTSSITYGQGISIRVNASDNDGISRVEFYVNGSRVYTDTRSPYSHVFVPDRPGQHSIYVTAYDTKDGVTQSGTHTVNARLPVPRISLNNGNPKSIQYNAPSNVIDDIVYRLYRRDIGSSGSPSSPYANESIRHNDTPPFVTNLPNYDWSGFEYWAHACSFKTNTCGGSSNRLVVRHTYPTPRISLVPGSLGSYRGIRFDATDSTPADFIYELYRRPIGSNQTPSSTYAIRSKSQGNNPPFHKNLPNNDWAGFEYLARVCSSKYDECGSFSTPVIARLQLPTPEIRLVAGNLGSAKGIRFDAPENTPDDFVYELFRRDIGVSQIPSTAFATRSVAEGNEPPFHKNLPNQDWSGYEYLARVCSTSYDECGSYSAPLKVSHVYPRPKISLVNGSLGHDKGIRFDAPEDTPVDFVYELHRKPIGSSQNFGLFATKSRGQGNELPFHKNLPNNDWAGYEYSARVCSSKYSECGSFSSSIMAELNLPTPSITLVSGSFGSINGIRFDAPEDSPEDFVYELYRRDIGGSQLPTSPWATRSVAAGNEPPFHKNLPNDNGTGFEYLARVCSSSHRTCGDYSPPVKVSHDYPVPTISLVEGSLGSQKGIRFDANEDTHIDFVYELYRRSVYDREAETRIATRSKDNGNEPPFHKNLPNDDWAGYEYMSRVCSTKYGECGSFSEAVLALPIPKIILVDGSLGNNQGIRFDAHENTPDDFVYETISTRNRK